MWSPPPNDWEAIAGREPGGGKRSYSAKAVARMIAVSTALLVVLHDLIGWPVFLVAIGVAALAADMLLRRRNARADEREGRS